MSESVEKQISSFVGKYSPEIATQLRDARKRLRSLFPRGYELVFDNYNALVFGISPTDSSVSRLNTVTRFGFRRAIYKRRPASSAYT